MKTLVAIVVVVLNVLSLAAQDKFTLSGYVRDSLSGETLIGATVTISGKSEHKKPAY